MGVITGLLSKNYTHLLGTLAMTSWFLMMKKILSTILHHTSQFFPGSTKKFLVLQVRFIISDIVFGCDNATYNSSPVGELSFLTQFLAITALQSLVLEK